MLKENVTAQDAREQYKDFKANRPPLSSGEILEFTGVSDYDVYNPTTPFLSGGKLVMACRVEKRDNEISRTMFFSENNGKWALIPDAPVFDGLQDPCVAIIDGEIVLGGVYVEWDWPKLVRYATYFYKGKTIYDLKFFAQGPEFMKDIRLVEFDGKIGIFSRPQGEAVTHLNCIAKIGFASVASLSEITPEVIANARLIEGHFKNDEWGGSNQIFVLKNGLLGVIGHKSWGETGSDGVFLIHYYPMAFAFDPKTFKMTDVKIIGSRNCFPKGPQKNTRTEDVVFTSGIIRNNDGTAVLYGGLSDCQIGKTTIPDPFLEYENL